MKVAQVSPLHERVPPSEYGGTERIVSYLTEELVRQGHEVTLFASGDSLTSARLLSPRSQSLRTDPTVVDTLAHHYALIEMVCRHREEFDFIHFHIDYLHFPWSRHHGLPQMTTLHGRLDYDDLLPVFREYREMPVSSISDAQRAPLPGLNWQGNVYHGLPPDLYEPHYGAGKYLAFLGRVSPEKGLDRAIMIAGRAGMKLKVAAKVDRADRDYYDEVIAPLIAVSPFVEFIGEIGDRDKSEFLGNAAALLFPIDWPEPFGLVMIEAMACATPILAFSRGSVPEVMEDGVSGFIVDGIDEAVEALGRLHEVSREGCRQYFERRFTAERMAIDYVRLYQRLVDGRAHPAEVIRGTLGRHYPSEGSILRPGNLVVG